MSTERVLWAEVGGGYPDAWKTSRLDGSSQHVVATGDVLRCGHPLMNDEAIALDDGGRTVLGLSLDEPRVNWKIDDNPLTRSQCVAGEPGLIAVTGTDGEERAVAIHDDGGWTLLHLPPSRSVLEPLVHGGRVLVAAPEEDHRRHGRIQLHAAGAVYIIERRDGRWGIAKRIIAPAPRDRNLFGFSMVADGDELFLNYFVTTKVDWDHGYMLNQLAPVVCRVALSRAGAGR
jgi:hypothetical protein